MGRGPRALQLVPVSWAVPTLTSLPLPAQSIGWRSWVFSQQKQRLVGVEDRVHSQGCVEWGARWGGFGLRPLPLGALPSQPLLLPFPFLPLPDPAPCPLLYFPAWPGLFPSLPQARGCAGETQTSPWVSVGDTSPVDQAVGPRPPPLPPPAHSPPTRWGWPVGSCLPLPRVPGLAH